MANFEIHKISYLGLQERYPFTRVIDMKIFHKSIDFVARTTKRPFSRAIDIRDNKYARHKHFEILKRSYMRNSFKVVLSEEEVRALQYFFANHLVIDATDNLDEKRFPIYKPNPNWRIILRELPKVIVDYALDLAHETSNVRQWKALYDQNLNVASTIPGKKYYGHLLLGSRKMLTSAPYEAQ